MKKQRWLYMCKASGLQSYIFATNRLKDVVGASQLIKNLTGKYLDAALSVCGVSSDGIEIIQRAAGQATILIDDRDALERLVTIWPAACAVLAPDLSIQQWYTEVTSTRLFDHLQEGWDALRDRRNLNHASLPELTPPVLRTPASGAPAVRIMRRSGGERELVDAATRRKRRLSEDVEHVVEEFEPGDVRDDWAGMSWALETDDMARGEKTYLSVIHADGNRLGKFLIALAEEARKIEDIERVTRLYHRLSDGLGEATRNAVIAGLSVCDLAPIRGEIVPARPVVLGGDDVTLLLPSTHAIQFTQKFMEEFQGRTGKLMEELASDYGELENILAPLTACAGIVFQRSRQPLIAGAEVSEMLCRFAKNNSRRDDGTASSLMFARLLDYNSEDLEQRIRQDFVDPTSRIRLTAGPYAVSSEAGLTTIAALEDVVTALGARQIGVGSVRGVVDALHVSMDDAQYSMQRTRAVAGADGHRLRRALERAARERRGEVGANFSELSVLPDAALLHAMRSHR